MKGQIVGGIQFGGMNLTTDGKEGCGIIAVELTKQKKKGPLQ